MTALFQQTLDSEVINFDENLDCFIAKELKKQQVSISFAESLTGGLMSHRLNQLPGYESFFNTGILCKNALNIMQFCGVSIQTIKKQGVVSRDVAIEMAVGLKQKSRSDIAIANTGISETATTKYGSEVIGKVFIAFAFKSEKKVRHYQFFGSHQVIQLKTAQAAFMELKSWLINQQDTKID